MARKCVVEVLLSWEQKEILGMLCKTFSDRCVEYVRVAKAEGKRAMRVLYSESELWRLLVHTSVS